MIIGTVVLIPVLITGWLMWGPVIPSMAVAFMAYFIWGHLLPVPLFHVYFDYNYTVSYLSVGLNKGIFGYLLPISANMIIFFMLFGAMMGAMGVTPGFLELGKLIGRLLRGGPAYMAWLGSSLFAMVSGSGSGNVAVTGTFTIPAMKAHGFTPEDAAFIMSAFIGVPYLIIMQKAVVGAALFYITVFIGIFFFCNATGKERSTDPVDRKLILRRFPIFVVGLAVVILVLVNHFSVGYACGFDCDSDGVVANPEDSLS